MGTAGKERAAYAALTPAAVTHSGALWLPVSRFPESDVRGAVFGRLLELHEPAAKPVRPELRRCDLEVQVSLAARFGDLAPAGAYLVALPGINPMIRCLARTNERPIFVAGLYQPKTAMSLERKVFS